MRRLACALALLLGGCSPSYDWREIRAEDDHYLAMMPGKPDALTLPIDLAGMKVSMTMRGARVGDGLAGGIDHLDRDLPGRPQRQPGFDAAAPRQRQLDGLRRCEFVMLRAQLDLGRR